MIDAGAQRRLGRPAIHSRATTHCCRYVKYPTPIAYPRDRLACWGFRPEPMGVAATSRDWSLYRIRHGGDGPWSWRYSNPLPRDCVHARDDWRPRLALTECLIDVMRAGTLAESSAINLCGNPRARLRRRRVFVVSACLLLAVSIVVARQQDRDLSGIHGIPVEGHDIVAGVEIVGTKQLDLSRSGWHKLDERLRASGAQLRPGWPLENQTLCRFKEVLRDVMSEKGFLDIEITHDTRPTYGNPHHLTLKFTIVEGKRSRPAAPVLSPAERCMR